MKVNSLQRYEHTADYYDFRLVANIGVGNTQEYFFDRTLTCRVYNDNSSRLFLYVPIEFPLRLQSRVSNLRDREGKLIVGAYQNDVGFSYDVANVDPVLNAFGYVDSLRYTLVRP